MIFQLAMKRFQKLNQSMCLIYSWKNTQFESLFSRFIWYNWMMKFHFIRIHPSYFTKRRLLTKHCVWMRITNISSVVKLFTWIVKYRRCQISNWHIWNNNLIRNFITCQRFQSLLGSNPSLSIVHKKFISKKIHFLSFYDISKMHVQVHCEIL